MQVKPAFWCRHSQQARVQILQVCKWDINTLGHQPQINRVGNLHRVIKHFRIGIHVIQAILLRILRHDGDGHDDRDIVAGLFGENVAAVELPKIGVSGAFDCALHCAWAGVVGRHCQVPIAKLVVEIFQMAGGGAGRFFRVLPLVHPNVVVEIVSPGAASHKLPNAAGTGA